jgi:hypothetical protein
MGFDPARVQSRAAGYGLIPKSILTALRGIPAARLTVAFTGATGNKAIAHPERHKISRLSN